MRWSLPFTSFAGIFSIYRGILLIVNYDDMYSSWIPSKVEWNLQQITLSLKWMMK